MADFTVRPLDSSTWESFAALIESHSGVWGGCWCMGFHPEGFAEPPSAASNRENKRCRVDAGQAHAALVFDGDRCVGWCQYGPVAELTRIKHRKAYEDGQTDLPDWRITCFFVDRAYRRQGVAARGLQGAIDLIASVGGGVIESYPEDAAGRKVSGSFLHNGTVAMFERAGFVRTRRIGKDRWVVRLTIP